MSKITQEIIEKVDLLFNIQRAAAMDLENQMEVIQRQLNALSTLYSNRRLDLFDEETLDCLESIIQIQTQVRGKNPAIDVLEIRPTVSGFWVSYHIEVGNFADEQSRHIRFEEVNAFLDGSYKT